MSRRERAVGACLALFACAPPSAPGPQDTDDAVPPADTDTDAAPVEDTDADTDVDADSDAAPSCVGPPVVFVLASTHPAVGTVDVVEGVVVSMERGGQAVPTWHLPLSARVEHVEQANRVLLRMVDVETGQVVSAEDPARVNTFAVADEGIGFQWACRGTMPDLRVIVDPYVLVPEAAPHDAWQAFCARRTRLEVELQDAEGSVLAQRSLEVVLQPDPVEHAPCPLDAW